MFDDNATSLILDNHFDKCHTSLVGIISVSRNKITYLQILVVLLHLLCTAVEGSGSGVELRTLDYEN